MHKAYEAISRKWGGGRVSGHRRWQAQAAGWWMISPVPLVLRGARLLLRLRRELRY